MSTARRRARASRVLEPAPEPGPLSSRERFARMVTEDPEWRELYQRERRAVPPPYSTGSDEG